MFTREEIAKAKIVLKRDGGFKLVGKYYQTPAQKQAYLERVIRHMELNLQAAREMLEEKDFD